MTKEKITMTKEMIAPDYIHITCEHTQFCKINRIQYPNINALEKDIKQLRKELKNKKTKLDKTDTLKLIKDQKQEYKDMVNDYNNTFDQLVAAWEKKMETGMFTGYGDDEYYKNILKPLEYKLIKMDNLDSILSKIKRIENKVNEIKNNLEYGTEYLSVAI